MHAHAFASAAGRRDHPSRFERVAVDPRAPHMLEFLREEVLRGTIRVVPDGRKRLVILPSMRWYIEGETAVHPPAGGPA